MLSPFAQELVKLSYGINEHSRLTGVSAGSMKAGPGARKLLDRGTVKADLGIRNPVLPHTDPMHSFNASQSPKQIGQNVAASQRRGAQSVAKAMTDTSLKGRVLRGARLSRGLAEVGQGSHQLGDITAHGTKLPASSARAVVPNTGYGGGIVAGAEHQRAGVIRRGSEAMGKNDLLHPATNRADQVAMQRQAGYGRASRRMMVKEMVNRGMTPQQAEAAVANAMRANPGRLSQVVGEASRNARYIRHEAGRAASTARTVATQPKRVGKAVGRVGRAVGRRLLTAAVTRGRGR